MLFNILYFPNILSGKHRKIPLIRTVRIYGERTNLMGLYLGWTYIREEKHFNLRSVKLTFLSFFQYKARILAFFTLCNKDTRIYNKDTRIRKVNDKVKNKDTVDVVLVSLLLILNTFHLLLQCFYC